MERKLSFWLEKAWKGKKRDLSFVFLPLSSSIVNASEVVERKCGTRRRKRRRPDNKEDQQVVVEVAEAVAVVTLAVVDNPQTTNIFFVFITIILATISIYSLFSSLHSETYI